MSVQSVPAAPATAQAAANSTANTAGASTAQRAPSAARAPAPVPVAVAPAPAPRSMLAGVTSGKRIAPLRVLLYGVEGIGKSSFGAAAPSPIFLETEDGTGNLDVNRFPRPQNWGDVMSAIRELTLAEHPYKTLVIDTIDWLEPLCFEEVCRKARKPDIEAFENGKGYTAALDLWRLFLAALEQLRAKKSMHIILLGHTKSKPFSDPQHQENYDRYSLMMNEKAGGLLKQWCDVVLFANWNTFVRKSGNSKAKGFSDGSRVVATERRAAFDAKNRFGLPVEMPLDWSTFYEATLGADEVAQRIQLRIEFDALLPRVSEADQEKVVAWLMKDPSAEEMRKWINKLQTMAHAAEAADPPADPTSNQ